LGKLVNNDRGIHWYKTLAEVEYVLNNSVNKSTGETPSRLLFGLDQNGQIDEKIKEYLDDNVKDQERDLKFLQTKAAANIVKAQNYNIKYFNAKHKLPYDFKEGDYIMVRNFDSTPDIARKLIPQFKGPYVVTKKLRNDRYVVADIEGFQQTQKKYQGTWEAKNMRLWLSKEK
jgi:hypothetical protein